MAESAGLDNQSVHATAYKIPSAGIAALLGPSTTSRGVAYSSTFGEEGTIARIFGGKPTGGHGGGGGARNRVFFATELRDKFSETGEPVHLHHLQYKMQAYGPQRLIAAHIEEGTVVCHMSHKDVMHRCDVPELKHLCSLHGLNLPRRPVREELLRALEDHECQQVERGVCDPCYAVMSPVTTSQALMSVQSKEFACSVKKFDCSDLRGLVRPEDLEASLEGFQVTAVDTNEIMSVDGKEALCIELPLAVVVSHLSIAGLEAMARHHGVVLPRRGKLKKAEMAALLLQHRCSGCVSLWYSLVPLTDGKLKVSSSRKTMPSWLDCLDTKERPVFVWESFVNSDSEAWPPRPTTMRDVASAMQGFCNDLRPEAIEQDGCKVCGQLVTRTELRYHNDRPDFFEPLKEDGVSTYERRDEKESTPYVADLPVMLERVNGVCDSCDLALKKQKRPKMALANHLWVGEIPDVLKDLTLAEQALIARVRHNRCVVRVSSGHAKMIANVITFEHPSVKIYDRLPIAKDELDDVLAVVFTGVVKPNEDQLKRTPVLVRRNQVKRALEWLKLNHRNYADLLIDYDALNTYGLEDVPVGVWHKPVGEDEGNVLATAKSVFDNDDDVGTSDGPCPFTIHGLTTERFSTMSSTERKLAAVQHLKNGGAFLAVGHAPDPQTIWDNPDLYPQMFPWLFPYGYGGVGQTAHRGVISKEAHLKWLLLYHDKRFQRDANFLIIAFNHQLIKQNSHGTFMMCKRNNFASVATSIRSLQPGVIASIAQRMRSGGRVVPSSTEEKKAFSLLDQVEVVGAHVNGSLASKKHQRNEIWSLMNFIGAPNWFVTLSPADNKHPLCIYWASEDVEFKPDLRSAGERLHLVTRNPVACARFFDYVVRLFIEHILGWKADGPTRGVFGKPCGYYGCVEQQGRMTLHLHMLIWIANALSPQEIRERLMSDDGEFQRKLVAYIESCQIGEFMTGTKEEVSARVPYTPNIDLRGIHTLYEDVSSKTVDENYVNPTLVLPEAPPAQFCKNVDDCLCTNCQALESWYGRFKASVDDILLRSNVHKCFGRRDDMKNSGREEKTGTSAATPKRHATGKGCINKDGICTARFPREIFLKTFVDLQTGQLFMKKLDSSINTITPTVSRCFMCNTDTTSLMSGTAVKAVIGYVTDYVTKGWLKTHQIFSSMYDVFSRDADIDDGELKPIQAARKMVLRVVNSLSSKMEIGAPMAALYLLQNPDHYTSHEFVTFYWKNFVNQVQDDWKECLELNESFADDQVVDPEVEDVGLTRVADTGVPGDLLKDDGSRGDALIIRRAGGHFVGKANTDDYVYRPPELGAVSLYEWIQCAVRVHTKTTRPPSKQLCFFRYMPEHPLSQTHVVACDPDRQIYIVPNFLGPALPRKDVGNREDYCRAMLTLFAPWRSGLDLKSSDATWDEAFSAYPFSERQRQLMDNFNLRYECYDARDDYGATFKAGACTKNDEDNLGAPNNEDEEDDIWNDGGDDSFLHGDDSEHLEALDIPGKECLDDRNMYGKALAAMKRAGWVAWDSTQRLSLELPRLVIDKALGAPAWRQIIKVQKQQFKDERRKTLDDMLTFDDEGGIGKVKNDAFVVSGSYLSKKFVPTEQKWSLVMEAIIMSECLNEEQEKAFRIIANHATCVGPEQLLMHLGGMGGTGKSTVIKALVKFFRERKEAYRFVLLGPTGTSAALIGGATYHSFLGLRTGQSSMAGESLSAIDDLKQRVLGVSYIFLDELSMLSCRDMCRISAKCCEAREMYEKPFGGINVILAGDFAQLPPAKGTKLYDNKVSLRQSPGQTIAEQENTIGKTIWLQFTTVVILKQNMRQIGDSEPEKGFQRALENLRYFACTDEDIALLRSRVPANNANLSLDDPVFRNVSIITARNRTKDQINESNLERFSRETGETLYEFVSADSLTNGSPKRPSSNGTGKKSFINVKDISRQMQNTLWSQRPHTSDQIPGTLRLCRGMPILIRHNEVTELCMTRGQEGRVVAWTSSPVPRWEGKRCLDVLYLELTNPPHKVKLPHLPPNVVPLTKLAQVLDARLPNDMYIHISRSQIPVLPNFAMTDYSSQGKTRTFNVVDISECRNFQAVYTCLSRGKSLEGTLILRDFTANEVRGKLNGALRQEFRELNYLHTITDLRFKGILPQSIFQATRWETIDRYRKWKSTREEEEWHPALQDIRPEDSITMPLVVPQVETLSSRQKREREHDTVGEPVKVKKRRTNTRHRVPTFLSPAGPTWDSSDWSCAFDALTFIVYTLWKTEVQKWSPTLGDYSNIMNVMISGFENINPSEDLLAQLNAVRNDWRQAVRASRPGAYPEGRHGTEFFDLCRDLLALDLKAPGHHTTCLACGTRAGRRILGLRPVGRFAVLGDEQSIQEMVNNRMTCLTECKGCRDIREMGYPKSETIWVQTGVTCQNTELNTHIDVPGWGSYRLAGLVYHGSFHFVSRAVLDNGKVYVHDGAEDGYSTHEGTQGATFAVDDFARSGNRAVVMVMYAKVSPHIHFDSD